MTASVMDIPVARIDGAPATLGDFGGEVLLVVNVASKCGLTPQYEALEALYREKHGEGFEVLGFPANEFMSQEPGTEAEIADFCSVTYDVTFPMFSKIVVKGEGKHPLYQALTAAKAETVGDGPMREKLKGYGVVSEPGEMVWNFEKFLIGRDGSVVERFAPDVVPTDPRVVEAIDRELAKGG
jgi:glutathione peroxidase